MQNYLRALTFAFSWSHRALWRAVMICELHCRRMSWVLCLKQATWRMPLGQYMTWSLQKGNVTLHPLNSLKVKPREPAQTETVFGFSPVVIVLLSMIVLMQSFNNFLWVSRKKRQQRSSKTVENWTFNYQQKSVGCSLCQQLSVDYRCWPVVIRGWCLVAVFHLEVLRNGPMQSPPNKPDVWLIVLCHRPTPSVRKPCVESNLLGAQDTAARRADRLPEAVIWVCGKN